jgi:hypothetical protein
LAPDGWLEHRWDAQTGMECAPIRCDRHTRYGREIVEQKAKATLSVALTLGVLVLAGFVGVSYAVSQDDATVAHYANDRANHHPVHEVN